MGAHEERNRVAIRAMEINLSMGGVCQFEGIGQSLGTGIWDEGSGRRDGMRLATTWWQGVLLMRGWRVSERSFC